MMSSNSGSPPLNNGMRSAPTSASMNPRSLLAGGNSQMGYMPSMQGMAARENAFYPGMPTYQLPHLNRYAIPQNQHIMERSPESGSELTSSALVEQLVLAEDCSYLSSIGAEHGFDELTISKDQLFSVLCKVADEMLYRQIVWIKKLPFFETISIKDHTTLLSTTWAEIILLASLCVHEDQLFGDLADITSKYLPDSEELSRFTDYEMEILERMTYLYQKFTHLKIDKEEYVIMKVINFLNQDIKGLQEVERVEEINKRYWYACQRFTELRAMERNAGRSNGSPNSTASGASRFRDLMLCLPEIRYVAGKMLNTDVTKLPLLFKAILHTCKLQKLQSAPVAPRLLNEGVTSSTPPSPTSSPTEQQRSVRDEDKMAAAASMLNLTTDPSLHDSSMRLGSGSVGPPSSSSTVSPGAHQATSSPRSSHGRSSRDSLADSP
uniref:NR LBD domain-containing protein n=1 Tax=Ciona savignyi TaxID=51511 RepID=H2YGS6_CIOSA